MEELLEKIRDGMRKATEVIRNDISTIRSGRATPLLVSHLVVTVYGGSQRLKMEELATITTQDAKTLVVAPFDPSIIGEIEKGILEANTGLTPVVDGDILRISIPALSEERRKEFVKLLKAKIEAGRVMVRQVRHEGMKDVKKLLDDKTITEDQKKHADKKIQEFTDETVAEVDSLGEKKETELLAV